MYIIFLLPSFRDARVNRYSSGSGMASPFLTAIEPVLRQHFSGDMSTPHAPFCKSQLVLLGEKDSCELRVIAMTIHHGGQPR